MSFLARLLLFFLCAFGPPRCASETTLSDPGPDTVDSRLIGTWRCGTEKRWTQFTVSARRNQPGTMDVLYRESPAWASGRPEFARFVAWRASIGGRDYLTAIPGEGTRDVPGQFIIAYRFLPSGRVLLAAMDGRAIRAAIESGELPGRVDGSGAAIMTAPRDRLAAFLARRGPGELFWMGAGPYWRSGRLRGNAHRCDVHGEEFFDFGRPLVEIEVALSDPGPDAVDERLLGLWRDAEESTETTFRIFRIEPGTMGVTVTAKEPGGGPPTVLRFRAWRANAGGRDYVTALPADTLDQELVGRFLVAYEVTADDRLVLRILMDQEPVMAAIKSGALAGRSREDIHFLSGLVLTAPRDRLRDFLAARHDELYPRKEAPVVTLRRVR